MNRTEVLRLKREEILMNVVGGNRQNRVKYLIALMDIDDEIEEIGVKENCAINEYHVLNMH